MSAATQQPRTEIGIFSFLRDTRTLQIIGQIIFAIILIAIISRITIDVLAALQQRNLTPNFSFLQIRAGFDITESPEWYTSNSNYGDAFLVGVINTLRIVIIGLFAATVIGVFVGIFLLSTNYLVRTISKVYVEILRNTPLLVQLFVWYYIVAFSLPQFQNSLSFPQEGVTLIGLRLFIYIAVIFFALRAVRQHATNSPVRIGVLTAVAATIFMIEAGFWLGSRVESWQNVYARGNLYAVQFLIYFGVSVVLIAASTFVPKLWRSLALGATIGQLIGGLLFYFGIVPNAAFRIELYPIIYMNIRGFAFPELLPTARFAEWMAFVGLGIALALIIYYYFGRLNETTGQQIPNGRYAFLALIILVVVGWFFVGIEPEPTMVPVEQDGTIVSMLLEDATANGLLTREDQLLYSRQPLAFFLPERSNFRFTAGAEISPEYMALLVGLVIYTSAFIAEIVRAGIQAVPHGQLEAARALGLNSAQTLRQVILPQALRVIIPPLGNQYLNLAKNSSLAIAVAFDDMFRITYTIMNQSGQSVTGMFMIMVCYLAMSLTIATITNWANRRFQLVTR